jgi:hypothetical protein
MYQDDTSDEHRDATEVARGFRMDPGSKRTRRQRLGSGVIRATSGIADALSEVIVVTLE